MTLFGDIEGAFDEITAFPNEVTRALTAVNSARKVKARVLTRKIDAMNLPIDAKFVRRLASKPIIYKLLIDDSVPDNKKVRLLLSCLSELGGMGKRSRAVRIASLNALQFYGVNSLMGQRPYLNQIGAVQKWIHKNINYLHDPWNVEMFQQPETTLNDKAGDCDDMSTLAAGMLGAIGFPTGVMIVDAKGTGVFDHAMAVVKTPMPRSFKIRNTYGELREWNAGREWLPIELTKPMRPGWLPPTVTKHRIVMVR
jgi:hypothetical protein